MIEHWLQTVSLMRTEIQQWKDLKWCFECLCNYGVRSPQCPTKDYGVAKLRKLLKRKIQKSTHPVRADKRTDVWGMRCLNITDRWSLHNFKVERRRRRVEKNVWTKLSRSSGIAVHVWYLVVISFYFIFDWCWDVYFRVKSRTNSGDEMFLLWIIDLLKLEEN